MIYKLNVLISNNDLFFSTILFLLKFYQCIVLIIMSMPELNNIVIREDYDRQLTLLSLNECQMLVREKPSPILKNLSFSQL